MRVAYHEEVSRRDRLQVIPQRLCSLRITDRGRSSIVRIRHTRDRPEIDLNQMIDGMRERKNKYGQDDEECGDVEENVDHDRDYSAYILEHSQLKDLFWGTEGKKENIGQCSARTVFPED